MGSTAITPVIDLGFLARRLGLPVAGIQSVVELLDAGNTIPFIARYRRDQTGGFDEEAVRRIQHALARARQLADRKQTVLRTIQGQGTLSPELEQAIASSESLKQLEDLYLPFKPRKLSLAEVARQRQLEPLAREILGADPAAADLDRRAADFVSADAGLPTSAEVMLGVGHIIADEFSERADLRQRLRMILHRTGRLRSQRVEEAGKALSKDEKHYRDYFDYGSGSIVCPRIGCWRSTAANGRSCSRCESRDVRRNSRRQPRSCSCPPIIRMPNSCGAAPGTR